MPRYTVELRSTVTTTRTAIVSVEAPNLDAVKLSGWEDDWDDWESIDSTDDCDEIEMMDITLVPAPAGKPDVDLTPI